MPVSKLTDDECEIVRRCLVAAAEGPYFSDWEFPTLFGATRDQVADVLSAWPPMDEQRDFVRLVINNTLANVLGYPHGRASQLEKELGVTTTQLEQLFVKWRDA